MLEIPTYIKEAEVQKAPLTYEWDSDNDRNHWAAAVPALERKIGKVEHRSVVLFCAGTAGWIAWRLSGHTDDPSLFNCIEATYASVVDWRYFNRPKKFKIGKGPIQGPKEVAIYLLAKSVDRAGRGMYVADIGGFLCKLVEHVLPGSVKPFRAWRDEVLDRLRKLEPHHPDKPTGNPVPREILNPGAEFKRSDLPKLLAAFVRTLDYKKNPYLSPPDKMAANGFKGVPYKG
jgi:hypothetical protein